MNNNTIYFGIILFSVVGVSLLLYFALKQKYVTGPPPPSVYTNPVGPNPRPYFFYDFGGVYSGGKWPSQFDYPTYTLKYPNSVCNPGCKCGTPYPCDGPCPEDFSCDLKPSTFNYDYYFKINV